MKQFFIYLLLALVFIAVGWVGNTSKNLYFPLATPTPSPKPTPLAKYSIENLSNTQFKPSEVKIDPPTQAGKNNLFSFLVDNKKVTGRITTPDGTGPFPLIVMIRGYVDPKIYYTGLGTKNAADYFTKQGFITIAPDFLGYAGSDKEASDIFESRFQTYIVSATLLKSVNTKNFPNWDGKNIFIWGHSNGGQIAITTLEIMGVSDPDLIGATVLWAPVTKPFPYSILYYTDDADDHGKFLRLKLADFESIYDVEKYSLTNYLDKIKAPILLNQGTADDAVPYTWSDNFVKSLKEKNIDVSYIKYAGADHNLNPKWNEAVKNSLEFYKSHLK